ncbi:MAG: hypothetical protein QXD98_02815 [Candidatus Diapherotrites archaeon]
MAISPAKRKLLKESIDRLFGLGLSESEILDNLKAVGVDEKVALEIMAELKGKKKPEPKVVKESQAVLSHVQSNVVSEPNSGISDTDFFEDVYVEPEEEPKPKVTKVNEVKVENVPQVSSSKPVSDLKPDLEPNLKNESLNELWEKGILATVDARLTEMQKIKEELDNIIDSKIAEKFKVEAKKFDAVFDSQVQIFNAKLNAKLDSKLNEISKVLEAKAKELEDANSLVQEALNKLNAEKKLNAEILNSINDKLNNIDTLRSQLSSEMNVFFETNNSKFNDFLAESVRKRDEIEARITRSLQLESKITEGLIEDAKHKIDAMRFEKEAEIEKKVLDKIAELDDMTKKVDPKGVIAALDKIKETESVVNSKLVELDKKFDFKFEEASKKLDAKFNLLGKRFEDEKQEFSKFAEKKFSELQEAYVESLDEMFSKQLVVWDSKIKEKLVKLSEIEAKMDVEKFNATLESFDVFKEQFVATITKSIEDYNKTKKDLANFLVERDKAIDRHISKLDQKLEELSVFQQKLLSILNELPDNEKGDKKHAKK